MCFSASASFAAAGVLGALGWTAVRSVTVSAQKRLAYVPCLFAVQQLIEGIVWLVRDHPTGTVCRVASHGFLFFALLLWPVYLGRAFAALEPHGWRPAIMLLCSMVGFVLGSYLLYASRTVDPTRAVAGHLVYYPLALSPAVQTPVRVGYAVTVLLPGLLSRTWGVRLFGILLLGSLWATTHFFTKGLMSVWCFFAAVLSVMIVAIVRSGAGREAYGVPLA